MGLRTCIAMVVLLVPLFKAANQTNYTIEAFSSFKTTCFFAPILNSRSDSLVSLYKYTWVPGKNIPCDLHMEHLNHDLKTAIPHRGANKQKKELFNLESASLPCQTLVVITTISEMSGYHLCASSDKDLNTF